MKRLRMMRAPLKYVQGKGALLQFRKEMEYMGKRWLFVCSNSGYNSCHEDLEKSFEGEDDYRRYEVFGGMSSISEIKKMQDIVEADKIDVVVAVGGGSAVDAAKATAYYMGKRIVIILQMHLVQDFLLYIMMTEALINIYSIRKIRMRYL